MVAGLAVALVGGAILDFLSFPQLSYLFCMMAASLEDVDGLGIVWSQEAYWALHHKLGHCIAFGIFMAAILTALSKRFFGDRASYNAELDLLQQAKQVPLPAAAAPPPFKPTPKVYPLVPPTLSGKPQAQAQPQPKGRPGWVD